MKLHFLASAVLALLSAVPGVFAEEPSSAVAKPIESFNSVLDAVTDEAGGLFGEEEFDAEEDQVSTDKDTSSKSDKKSSRKSSRKSSSKNKKTKRSTRKSSRRKSSRKRTYRDYRSYKKNMCRGRISHRDSRTCNRIEDEYCDTSRDRRRNSSLCRRVGFGDSKDYDEDSEDFDDEDYDGEDSEDFDDKDSEDYDEDSEDFDGELDAVSDEAVGLLGEEEFDAEEGQVSTAKDSSSKSNKESSRRKSSRRKSSRRKSSRRKSSRKYRGRSYRDYRRYKKNMCRGRISRQDSRTCDRIEDEFCDTSRDRRRNSSLCRRVGFGSDSKYSKDYDEDSEEFDDEDSEDYDEDSEEFDDEDSEDYDGDSEDFDGEDSGDYDEDEAVSTM